MRLELELAGGRRTDQHPELADDGPDLAIAAEAAEPGEVLVRVAWRALASTAQRYRSASDAVALLVDLPELGLAGAELAVERDMPGRRGPNWQATPPAATTRPSQRTGGWITARVRLDPPPRAPTTAFVRAALRDAVSPACRVEVRPAPAVDEGLS